MESNHRHMDFQSIALPTELSRHKKAGSRRFELPVSSVTGWRVKPLHHDPIIMVGEAGFEPTTSSV